MRRSTYRDIVALVVSVALCLAVSAVGGYITAFSVGDWYQTLAKPPFNPPDWLFAPVWTVLYLCMAVAAWRVWRCRNAESAEGSTGSAGSAAIPRREVDIALAIFVAQLGLNLGWSVLFFGMQRIDLALVEIFVLLVAIAVTICAFGRIDRLAGILLVPYIAWVAFATLLNGALWVLN